MLKHVREPLTDYQLLPCWLTARSNGFRNLCFVFNVKKLFAVLPKSNGPIGNKDLAKENVSNIWIRANATYISDKLNFSNMFSP